MKQRILILDEHEHTLLVLSETLTYFDYEIRGLSTSENIFETLEEFKPDLLLFDFSFPLLAENGGEICTRIKQNPLTNSLPIILISAYPFSGENMAFGCDCVLAKPFDMDILLNTINVFLCKNIIGLEII